ncbi:SLIT and NTRK-like protein 4 isoform X1 [Oreochromis aureus]|uniref:SLIT and NTRK-like protein 4 isoform X1 n=1 Tax=Oreochromis aureus TaxID=47969 RepID=UPI001952CA43|nr:SLIT and NTRK-like protein 4 isoform X1 [Oreochromis aureus]
MLLVLLLAAFSSSISGSLASSLSSPSMSNGPPMADPSAPDLLAETCVACSCMSVENVLYVNCEEITVYRPTQLIPPTSSLYHLNFQNNFLIILYPNSFLNFTHAVSLHLGNNKLQNIEGGAFMGMSALKQLHLNSNELKVLRADTFLGIENLEYLQADYNLIQYIEKGAFNKLHKLKVLILNDNLIQALPDNIFRFASLTHLDIRGNRIQKLPYLGVLEHIGRIVELQLDDNPWNCTCDLAPLKAWLENMPYNIFIGEAICETPSDLYGRLLKETNKQELCPMGTGSEFDVRMPPAQPSKTPPTTVAPIATKAPKTTDSSKFYGNGIVAGRNNQIVSFQLCPQPCSCKAHPSDFGISVSCQERNIKNLADLVPKPPNAKKLHLSGNYIRDINPSDFQGFEGLDLLHLGSNQIVTVQKGVFANLTNLRRLYLNGNLLEQLHPEMFLGLTNLQYLYLEYNAIKEILAGTFDSMPNLQLLYLNNNVLRSLPAYVFAGIPLARLNLKNNHFMTLPVSGVLDQLRSLTQIDLEGNPWECSCDLVALKLWLQKLSDGVAAKEVKCASPVQFANIELRLLKNEILCPRMARPPFIQTGATPVLTSVSPAGVGKAPPGGPVPLSIMILSILVVLILTVFVAFCLLVFVLRRNKKPVGRQEGLGNQECGSMSLQLRRHSHKSGKKGSIPGDDLGGETFIPQTIEHIGKSHTCGIGRSSDLDAGFKFADSQRQKIILRNSADKEKDMLSTLERNKRLSTIDELEEFLPNREPSMFIHNFLDSKRDFNSIGMGGYEIRYPEKTLDKKMKKSSLIGGNHSKIVVEQRKSTNYSNISIDCSTERLLGCRLKLCVVIAAIILLPFPKPAHQPCLPGSVHPSSHLPVFLFAVPEHNYDP